MRIEHAGTVAACVAPAQPAGAENQVLRANLAELIKAIG